MVSVVRLGDLFEYARGLRSDPGSPNREYDRALVELVTDAAGLPMDAKSVVAAALGIDLGDE